MSASTNCGHHVLALARKQPAACKPDQSGSITLKQSCRLAVQTGLAIILGFLLSNESAYEPGLRAGVSQLEIPESDLGLGPTWSALPHSTAMFGGIRGIGPGTNQNRNANWFCNIPAA